MVADDVSPGPHIAVAIPAYNCSPQLPSVLGDLVAISEKFTEIWVIDNCSTDGTLASARSFKGPIPNLRVFLNSTNVSLGGTHKNAFSFAKAQGFTHVVILHGDNQASVGDIESLLEVSAGHSGATVLGSRFMPKSNLVGYDWKRVLGNRALNLIYSMFSGRVLTDLGSGLNLYKLDDLDASVYLTFENSLSFNYQLILELVRRKANFSYVPIRWSEDGQVSNARNVEIFASALKIVWKWRFTNDSSAPAIESNSRIDWTEY